MDLKFGIVLHSVRFSEVRNPRCTNPTLTCLVFMECIIWCMLLACCSYVGYFFQGSFQPSFYRAKKILALVPKPGKKSSDDDSSTQSEDEVQFSPFESGFGLGAKVVVALCKSIPNQACSVAYFDNFFTSLELIHYLRHEMGIFSLGTIRSNRLRGAEKQLLADKALKKKPRGSHSQVVCNSNKICIVKWFDNKCVTAASSYIEANPLSTAKRYDKKKKKKWRALSWNNKALQRSYGWCRFSRHADCAI